MSYTCFSRTGNESLYFVFWDTETCSTSLYSTRGDGRTSCDNPSNSCTYLHWKGSSSNCFGSHATSSGRTFRESSFSSKTTSGGVRVTVRDSY